MSETTEQNAAPIEESTAEADEEARPPPEVDPLAKEDAALGIRQPGTSEVPLPTIYPAIKRILELPVSLSVLLALSPILIAVYFASLIQQGSPVLFRFPRMGKKGRNFTIFKFRTMHKEAKRLQEEGVEHDSLITPFGHFLRNTHLDEVSQILNVVTGDISFVGPRPIDQDTFRHLCTEDVIWPNVLKTRPGITCLESVIADLPEHEEKIRRLLKIPPPPKKRMTGSLPRRYPLDMFYVENESLWTDLVLVWYTLRTVTGRAAKHK